MLSLLFIFICLFIFKSISWVVQKLSFFSKYSNTAGFVKLLLPCLTLQDIANCQSKIGSLWRTYHINMEPTSEVLIPEHSCCVCSALAPTRSLHHWKGLQGGVYWQYRLKSFRGASYLIPPALLRQKYVKKRIPKFITCTHTETVKHWPWCLMLLCHFCISLVSVM